MLAKKKRSGPKFEVLVDLQYIGYDKTIGLETAGRTALIDLLRSSFFHMQGHLIAKLSPSQRTPCQIRRSYLQQGPAL